MIPQVGQIAHLRARPYLIEEVIPDPGHQTLVRLPCLDDDALGEPLEVLWEKEIERASTARRVGCARDPRLRRSEALRRLLPHPALEHLHRPEPLSVALRPPYCLARALRRRGHRIASAS
jgi:hypothetical protein